MRVNILGGVAAAIVVSAAGNAWAQDVASVNFGANPPLKVVAPKGMTASAYASQLFEVYNNIIGSNAPLNRYISASDVVVLCPPAPASVIAGKKPSTSVVAGKKGVSSTPLPVEAKLPPTGTYIIYVMGRRFITVTPEMAKANGAATSSGLATKLARQYMQTFPRECFRPPTLPTLTNIPAKPPLKLTTNLETCIPKDVDGRVYLFGKGLFSLADVQPDGTTGPDKAGNLTKKTSRIMGSASEHTPEEVKAVKNGKMADVKVGEVVLYSFSDFDATSSGFKSSLPFAQFIAEQIGKRLVGPAPSTAPEQVPTTPPATPPATPPTTPPATPPAQP